MPLDGLPHDVETHSILWPVADGHRWGSGNSEGALSPDGGTLNAAEGFYMVEANIADLTYNLTPITTVGVIGAFNGGQATMPRSPTTPQLAPGKVIVIFRLAQTSSSALTTIGTSIGAAALTTSVTTVQTSGLTVTATTLSGSISPTRATSMLPSLNSKFYNPCRAYLKTAIFENSTNGCEPSSSKSLLTQEYFICLFNLKLLYLQKN